MRRDVFKYWKGCNRVKYTESVDENFYEWALLTDRVTSNKKEKKDRQDSQSCFGRKTVGNEKLKI